MLERILYLMESLNINKNQLAKLANLPRTTIYSALSSEENCRKTKLETMRPIAAALKTTLDYLITGNLDNLNIDNENVVVSVARGGNRVEYIIDENDAAIVDAFLNKFKKD